MKKLIKILSVFLAVIMAFASTSVAFASTKFYSKYDKKIIHIILSLIH